MEFLGMELIDTVQKGELFALLSPMGGFYHAERIPGRSSIWEFSDQGTETSVNAKTVVELLKSACGNYAGFRSHHAEGKVLQACRDKNMYLRFNNYNFDTWEQWSICGSSLDRCLLVNRKFPDKQFEASLHKVLIITELSLDTLLKRLNVKVKNEIMQKFGENAEEIATMRQANETVNGENARLQGQFQGPLSDAKACGKKLEESLLWKAIPEKEVHNLKPQVKKSKTKPKTSDFFVENMKERGFSVNLASRKSPRQKDKDAAGEVQESSASRHKVNGSISDFLRSWMLLSLFAVLCTCFAIKFWLIR